MKKENIGYLIDVLGKANGWVSAEEIAAQMHTTTRTVRSYVAAVNDSYPGEPILTSHAGYRWNPENIESMQLLSRLEPDIPETAEERIWYVLKGLAWRDQKSGLPRLSIGELCEKLAISDKTLEADLAKARKELVPFGLRLKIMREELELAGEEQGKRRLIFSCIRRYVPEEKFTFSGLSEFFGTLPVERIWTLVEEELKAEGLGCASCFRECLLLQLLVQMMRLQDQAEISERAWELSSLKELSEYAAARRLAVRLQLFCNGAFDEKETAWLAMLLLCYCHGGENPTDLMKETRKLTDFCLGRLGRMEEIDVSLDGFPDQVADYFFRLKLRCEYGMPVYNPIAASLRNGSPVIQDEAAWLMTFFRRQWGIHPSRDEVGFLTMLLTGYIKRQKRKSGRIPCTLICPSCFGLGYYLKERLEELFGESLKIDQLSEEPLHEKTAQGRMVISALRLSEGGHYVHITPSMTSGDAAAIRQELNRREAKRRCRYFRVYLECYSQEKMYERNSFFDSDKEAIRALCEKLEAAGYVEKGFHEAVLEREAADTTAYHNLIAVPHAVGSTVRRNSICILLNDRPISWGKKRKVNLIVLIAMERELKDDFRIFYETLISLFENRTNMKKLLEATDYTSFLNRIENLVQE